MKNYVKTFEDLELDDVFDTEASGYLPKLPIDVFNDIVEGEYEYIQGELPNFSVAHIESDHPGFEAMSQWVKDKAPELNNLTKLANDHIKKGHDVNNFFDRVFVQEADDTTISIEFNRATEEYNRDIEWE